VPGYLERQRKREELEKNYPAQVVAVRFLGNPLFSSLLAFLVGAKFASMHVAFQILLVLLGLVITVLLVSMTLTKQAREIGGCWWRAERGARAFSTLRA
jgi:hypothetical protein